MAEEGAKPMLANCYQLESILFGKVLQGCFEESEKNTVFFYVVDNSASKNNDGSQMGRKRGVLSSSLV